MATRKKTGKRQASGKPLARPRPRKAAGRLMTRAEMAAAVSEYTAEAIATMMKIVRSNAPDLAAVRAKAVRALRKHGWVESLPRRQAMPRKVRKPKRR